MTTGQFTHQEPIANGQTTPQQRGHRAGKPHRPRLCPLQLAAATFEQVSQALLMERLLEPVVF